MGLVVVWMYGYGLVVVGCGFGCVMCFDWNLMIDWLGVCNVVGGCFYWRNFMNCFFWIVLGMVLLLMVCNVFVFNEVFEGVVVVEGEEYGEYEEVLLEIKIVVKVV